MKYLTYILNNSPRASFRLAGKKLFPDLFYEQFDELRRLPRYNEAETKLFGKTFALADAPSFFSMYDEIIKKEAYTFKTNAKNPYIIDCGANIGLSVIFFKRLYPNAEIIAFEPDEKIANILQKNMNSFACSNVKIVRKALSDKEDVEIDFFSEGADGGRISVSGDMSNRKVSTTRLLPYLNKEVDMLKIDIEGAETSVIEDCAEKLKNVKNLFVEYHSMVSERQTLDRLLSILHKTGFRYYIHSIGALPRRPFIEKRNYAGMDMQLNIYACRF